ncbi:MAG TPA: sigma-70 family RNA polymerase sigma factor [Firmicutes bacterium]|nr:sigma-70 family RNA polymerase sigma factor [Bacillota bacterium]
MDDSSIIELFFSRSETAVARLLAQYGRLFHQLARNFLSSEEDVEECVNDAVLDVWSTIPPQNPRSLSAYSCALVRRRAVDRLRYKTAERRGGHAICLELEEGIAALEDAEDYLDQQELKAYLNAFLSGLSPENRRLFVRRYFYGESIGAIADDLRIRENTAAVRLSRLREQLRSYLREQDVWI